MFGRGERVPCSRPCASTVSACLNVVSELIVGDVCGRPLAETSRPGVVACRDETEEEGLVVGMAGEAGRPLDGDEDVLTLSLDLRQILEIDVDEAEGCLFEALRRHFGCPGPWVAAPPVGKAGAAQGPPDRTPRQAGIEATVHDNGDIIKAEPTKGLEFGDDRLLDRRSGLAEIAPYAAPVVRARQCRIVVSETP